ncbi:chemotaxis protein [Aurantiacibacter aquimixticola]|uniref:Chemotaxis protein n=2 Tax=Aurantiacibacter aquimixticola TaxID=1958945 RepID=A0A419RWW8_9SPHN|nr:chemotaxis protein [Aurantiacibacter aquimixticola]
MAQVDGSADGADVVKEFPIVGVGASAGGLEALREMFGGFEGKCGMAFVVVQHLDPNHESLMAQLLERYTSMQVSQATGGEAIQPDHVYVIPPGHGLALDDGVLNLTEFKDPRGMRRPIDDFFISLAKDRGGQAACVILSGTGADGSSGLRAIKEHGGLCIAQDPDTAAYDGMPSSAIGTGLVDIVSEPEQIVEHLDSFFRLGTKLAEELETELYEADELDDLCGVLHEVIGHDFSQYKRNTLSRRVARRMQVLGLDDMRHYVAQLREDENECEALFRDLLINVTSFFRDRIAFEKLEDLVIDPLVARSKDGEEIRVWVPGCSSGEEAYSIAMMFGMATRKHGTRPYIQIFATDIDEGMLEIGRAASYPLSAIESIPAAYRDEFIVGGTDHFGISPYIRDMVRFSPHNVMRDPPYSNIDLVSCRNLLIYFDDELQKTVIPRFHFALKQNGSLFLGSSEAIGRFEDLFETVDQSARLFRRRSVKGSYHLHLPSDMRYAARRRRGELASASERPTVNRVETDALQLIAQRYAPVSLMVDAEGMLVERWGSAGRYLEFPDKLERNVHVPTLARPGLREIVMPLMRRVRETGRRCIARNLEIKTEFGMLEARATCEKVRDGIFLLVIEDSGKLKEEPEGDADDFEDFDAGDGQVQFLEEELHATRHRLRSTVEELETTNEELKSSNEEMMSMNEELQSTNEELTTVNDELKNKVDQLTTANSDLKNFFDSTQLAVLVVDADMNIRSYTDAATELFPIDDAFLGKPLGNLPTNLETKDYLDKARRAARGEGVSESALSSDILDAEYIMRAMPYRLLDGDIDGATLVFTDVTSTLTLERELREESERLRLALEVARIGIWEYEPGTDTTTLDDTERRLLNIPEDDPGTSMQDILQTIPSEDRDRINKSLRMAMEGSHVFDEIFRLPLGNGKIRYLHGLGKLINNGGKRKFIGVTFDVSAEQGLLDQRELMIKEMNHRVKNLFSVIAAMVTIAARDADDVSSFADGLRERIYALGRSHALTNSPANENGSVELRELIETVLKPNMAGQELALDGENVAVSNDKLTSLALILHEWATNSAKYGALGVEDGSLAIGWREEDGLVSLEWRETGRAAGVEDDGTPGFGTRLVATAARQLQGEASGEASADGYRRELSFPAR